MITPQILLQGFYKRGKYIAAPCPADKDDGPEYDWWWDALAKHAADFAHAGFTAIWLPPVTKAEQGMSAAALGYSVFDDYDLGSKNQKATVHTRYGNREQLTRCVAMLRANGLAVYLDLQLNHRKGGSGADGMTFQYLDAYGKAGGGRFPKNAGCFHSRYPAGHVPADFKPAVPQDPNVPDGLWELQENSNVYFGPDLAHINGQPPGYVSSNVIASVNWLVDALGTQGFRLDHVQGISTDFLKQLLNQETLRSSFAVGEFWDGSIDNINGWITADRWMASRCSAFDFPLYFKLLAMSNDSVFDMAELDHAGLAGRNPFRAVTFVENHDTESRRDLVAKNIQPDDKPFAYAYILTSEGLPCVFIKDFLNAPGCLGAQLQPVLKNLMWIRQNLADGATLQRWKSQDVFVYERLGGRHLLVGLNRSKNHAPRLESVYTGFPPNTVLHDYAGHEPDVTTDAQGHVTLTLPKNIKGKGYVCYSVAGIAGEFQVPGAAVTQVFAGARDLDIKPAQSVAEIQITRFWVAAGATITATLTFDVAGWSEKTRVTLRLLDPAQAEMLRQDFHAADRGGTIASTAAKEGWHAFRIQSFDTPTQNSSPSFELSVTYTAPARADF